MFKVIIDMYVLIVILLIVWTVFIFIFLVLFSSLPLLFSSVDLMINFSFQQYLATTHQTNIFDFLLPFFYFIYLFILAAPRGMWNFLNQGNQGSNPCPLHWKYGVLTTGQLGKSSPALLILNYHERRLPLSPFGRDHTNCS